MAPQPVGGRRAAASTIALRYRELVAACSRMGTSIQVMATGWRPTRRAAHAYVHHGSLRAPAHRTYLNGTGRADDASTA